MNKEENDIHEFIIGKLVEYNKALNTKKIVIDSKLFEDGIIDSLSFVELIQDIQDKYNIDIEPEEINESNFASIGTLSNFVITKIS